jgi:hypothetical protein
MPTPRWNWKSTSRPNAPEAASKRETSAISSAMTPSATKPSPIARFTDSAADPPRGTVIAATPIGQVTRKR